MAGGRGSGPDGAGGAGGGPPAAPSDPAVLVVVDGAAWREWLDAHEDEVAGTWLLLARKGVSTPTSLVYARALEEALCSGWIDGQVRSVDGRTYRQRYTPRRPRSLWSARNVLHVERLAGEGRMRPRGLREVERAREDGRWARADEGPATMAVPEDLRAALDGSPAAASAFSALGRQDRYAVLFSLATAATEATRRRRLTAALRRLGAGAGEPT